MGWLSDIFGPDRYRPVDNVYGSEQRYIEVWVSNSTKDWKVGDPVTFRINGVVVPGQGKVVRVSEDSDIGRSVTFGLPINVEVSPKAADDQ